MKFLLVLLVSVVAVRAQEDEEEVCLMDPEPGPCRALLKRWAWNPVEEKCEPFYYGGCEGNGNNFETEKECKQECWDKHTTTAKPTTTTNTTITTTTTTSTTTTEDPCQDLDRHCAFWVEANRYKAISEQFKGITEKCRIS